MLTHEAWLVRRMRSSWEAEHPVLTGKLPYGEVLPYRAGRHFRDATPPSRQNPEVPICMDHVGLKAVARD